eukprot:7363414-Prymnesium_polylepis.2
MPSAPRVRAQAAAGRTQSGARLGGGATLQPMWLVRHSLKQSNSAGTIFVFVFVFVFPLRCAHRASRACARFDRMLAAVIPSVQSHDRRAEGEVTIVGWCDR